MKDIVLPRSGLRVTLSGLLLTFGWLVLSYGFTSSVLAQTVNATCNEATDPARTEFTIDPGIGGCEAVIASNYFFFPAETSDGFPLFYADGPNAGQQPSGGIANSTPVNLYAERMGSDPFTVTIGNFGGARCPITVIPPAGTSCAVNPPDPENVSVVGIPCYVNGRRDLTTQSDEAFLVVYYEVGAAADALQPDGSGITALATDDDIGSTYGVAYNDNTGNFYTSATLKRHADIGPGGTGAIYRISTEVVDGTPTGVLGGTWLDLNADPNISTGTIGTGAERGLGTTNDPNRDLTAYNTAGRISIGDIDISADNLSLYAVSLNDKKLVTIDISDEANPTVSGTLDINAATTGIVCANGELMPFGLGVDQSTGEVYLGCTCNGQNGGTTADLQAYVLRLNAAATGFEEALAFPLNYQRNGGVGLNYTAEWQPWNNSNDYTILPPPFANRFYQQYPQALIATVEILDDGSMLVGLLDRFGLQTGTQNIRPDQTALAGTGPEQESGRPCGDAILFAPDPAAPGTWLPDITPHSEDIREDPPNAPTNLFGDYFSVFENGAALGTVAYQRGQNDPTNLTGDEFIGSAVDPTGANQNGMTVMNLTNPPSRIDNQDVVDAGTQPRVAAKGLALGDVELGVLNPTCVITDLTVTCGESSSAGTTITVAVTRSEPGASNSYALTIPGYTVSNGTDNVGTYGAPATFTVTPPLPADGSVSVSVVDTDQPTCMASTVLDGSTCDRTGCALSISDVSVACSNGTDFTASFTVNWEFAEATSDMIEVTIDGDAQIFTPADVMGSQSFTDVALTGPAFGVLLEANFVANPECTTVTTIDLIACTPGCTGAADELGGNVFLDVNNDGVEDAAEGGQGNVLVRVYDCSETLLCEVFTNEDGDWSCDGAVAGDDYRVEYSLPLTPGLGSTFAGPDNKTSTQVVVGGVCDADFGVLDRLNFCEAGQLTILSCFEAGDGQANANPATLVFDYGTQGTDASPVLAVTEVGEVGSLYGKGIDQSERLVYATALLKRHVGLGPLGEGGVYVLDPFGEGLIGSFDLQNVGGIDVGTVDRSGAVGGDLALPSDPTEASIDLDAFGKVGKTAFGDTDIDGARNLWTVNLNQRALVRVPVAGYTPSIGGPPPGGVQQFPIDDLAGAPTCTNGVLRPYGLKFQDGLLYVGAVCDAGAGGTAMDLEAYVLAIDPTNPTGGATIVLNFPLGYAREEITSNTFVGDGSDWAPWSDDWSSVLSLSNGQDLHLPQPILSDIEFTDDGTMLLGFQDRFAHQAAIMQRPAVAGTDELLAGTVTAGDLLKACLVGGSYVLENNADCPVNDTTTEPPSRTDDGPSGAGEFFHGDDYRQPFVYHGEVLSGALVYNSGTNEVISTAFDPTASEDGGFLNSQGIRYLSLEDGSYLGGFTFVSGAATGDFGKGAALSDIEIICAPPAVQLGNYAWLDEDSDGVQDACEPPLSGLAVKLYRKVDGGGAPVLIATDTTDATGNYYFSSADNASGDTDQNWLGTGGDTIVNRDDTYFIVFCGDDGFDEATNQLTSGGLLLCPSPADVGADRNDSDITVLDIDGELLPAYCTQAGELRSGTNHTFDAGFKRVCPFVDLAPTQPATCGADSVALAVLVDSILAPEFFDYLWSTDGDGSFVDATGTVLTEPVGYDEAVAYRPGPVERSSGEATLTLGTEADAIPESCEVATSSNTVPIQNVDCGSFFWEGSN